MRLETTGAATAMRQSLWLYPIVEILHILGFVVLVGSAAMFDLRLLGLSRQLPVTGMERHLLRWARASVLLIAPTGGLMVVAHAMEFADNPGASTRRPSISGRSAALPSGTAAPAHRSRLGSRPGSPSRCGRA